MEFVPRLSGFYRIWRKLKTIIDDARQLERIHWQYSYPAGFMINQAATLSLLWFSTIICSILFSHIALNFRFQGLG